VYSATHVLFQAGAGPAARRTASIGPGIDCLPDDLDDEGDSPSRTPLPSVERPLASRFTQRISRASRRISADSVVFQRHIYRVSEHHDPPIPPYSPPQTPSLGDIPLSPTHSLLQLPPVTESTARALEEPSNTLGTELRSESANSA
jgi:hypothetical protein